MINEILPLLKKLINYQSISPKGEDVLNFISDFLNPLGFTCIIKTFGPNNEVANLYAYTSSQNKDPFNICFAGHVDVVPPMNESLWSNDPFSMTINEGIIYGRGVVDMKGSIACALIAAQKYIESNQDLSGNISFLLTTDEEIGGNYGTKKMLEYIYELGHKIDFCILGEPTSIDQFGDLIKIGRRGSINFDLNIKGIQGHVAYPDKALNPNKILAAILNEFNNHIFDFGTEFFQASNLEITSINCHNLVNNIIPEMSSAKFNIRFNHLHTPEILNIIITDIIKKYSNNFELNYTCSSLPFSQKMSGNISLFKQIVDKTLNIESKFETNGGTSDARFIFKYAEVVEFGVNCNQAHKIDERCSIGDLQSLYNVYYDSLIKFLGDS